MEVPIIRKVESTREANSDSTLPHCIKVADVPMGLCSGWKWACHKQNCKTLGREFAKCSSTEHVKILGLVICCISCTIIFLTILSFQHEKPRYEQKCVNGKTPCWGNARQLSWKLSLAQQSYIGLLTSSTLISSWVKTCCLVTPPLLNSRNWE